MFQVRFQPQVFGVDSTEAVMAAEAVRKREEGDNNDK